MMRLPARLTTKMAKVRIAQIFSSAPPRFLLHDADLVQLETLRKFIKEKDVDGWLITAASGAEAAVRKAAEARRMIPSSFWRQFSEHVEEAILAQAQGRELHVATSSAAEGVGVT